jgi:hypothetical protein
MLSQTRLWTPIAWSGASVSFTEHRPSEIDENVIQIWVTGAWISWNRSNADQIEIIRTEPPVALQVLRTTALAVRLMPRWFISRVQDGRATGTALSFQGLRDCYLKPFIDT